jgi:hypothetical protein
LWLARIQAAGGDPAPGVETETAKLGCHVGRVVDGIFQRRGRVGSVADNQRRSALVCLNPRAAEDHSQSEHQLEGTFREPHEVVLVAFE